MNVWKDLITKLSFSVKLHIPIDMILLPSYETVFTFVSGHELRIPHVKKLNNKPLTVLEYIYAWVAVKVKNNITTKDVPLLLSLYTTVNEFLIRNASMPIDQNTFDRKVREYSNYMLNGMSVDETDIIRKQIHELEEASNYFETITNTVSKTKFEHTESGVTLYASSLPSLDLFDLIIPNKYVPFISHNTSNDNRIFKYYNSQRLLPPVGWIQETNQPMNIVSKMFCRKIITDENYGSKAAYCDIVHPFNSNEYHVTVMKNSAPLNILFQRVRDTIPLDFTYNEITSISGYFVVRGIIIHKSILGDVITTDPVLRNVISLNEAQKPYNLKERTTFNIVVEPFIAIPVTFNMLTTTQSEVVRGESGNNLRLNKGETYVRVQASKIPNENHIPWLQDTITKILAVYSDKYEDIASKYASIFPPSIFKKVNIHDTKGAEVKLTKLDLLQNADPDLFIPSYASKIQSSSQPTLISVNEVEKYLAKGVQVVRYPAHIVGSERQVSNNIGTVNYYVSTTPDKPYLGLIENDLENCDRYPYLLASYKEKSLSIDPTTWDITISVEHSGKKSGGAKGYILDVNKLLQPHRKGEIKTRIALLLSEDYKRLGMPQSTSSFMHAIYYALNKHYATEEKIQKERVNMANTIYPSVCRQERYDYTDEEITKDFLDMDYILDPRQDYRMLEEYYDITIWTFTLNPTTDEPVLEVPRNSNYHARVYSPSDRRIVFVYKHRVDVDQKGCSQFNNPIHCELLVIPPRTKKGLDTTSFNDPLLKQKMLDLMKYFSNATKFHMLQYPSTEIEHTSNVNEIYAQIPGDPTHQNINDDGRVTSFKYADNTVITPSQPYPPLNIPSISFTLLPSANSNRKISAIIKTYVKTLFMLAHQPKQEFVNRIIVDENVEYDVTKVTRTFPIFQQEGDAIAYFSSTFPSLFRNKNIVANSRRLQVGIQTLVRNIYDTDTVNVIEEYYKESQDFISHKLQLIMFGEKEAYRILDYVYTNRQSRETKFHAGQEPYLFKIGNTTFLVQSVILGDKLRALTVANTWIIYGINSGYYTHIDADIKEVIPVVENFSINSTITKTSIVNFQGQYIALLLV
jgi:hypothetical protein